MMRRHSIHPFAYVFPAGIACGTALVVLALLAPSVARAQTPPCADSVRCEATTTAYNGQSILIRSYARNCGDGVATIVITLSGPSGVIGSHAITTLAGTFVEFDTVFVISCAPGAQTVWTVSAVAQNASGTSQPVSSTCSTTCAKPPDIGIFHCNDASGNNLNIGKSVTIGGVVTELSFTATAVRMYVQDATGGIGVFGASPYCPANLGDDVTVWGTFLQDNGLAEVKGLDFAPLTIVVNSMGNPDPAPLSLTPAQVNATFQANHCEPNESRLVQVTCSYVRTSTGEVPAAGATFAANTSYQLVDVSDPASNCTMFISKPSSTSCPQVNPLIGTTIPTTSVLIAGVLSQSKTTAPFTSGYEIIPRLLTDLAPCQPVPTLEGTWGKLKSRYR